MQGNYHPVIVFSFSKRDSEAQALSLTKYEFNSQDDKDLVNTIFPNAIDNLSDD